MPKKSRNKNVGGMSIQELRDQLAQREKQVRARIAELEKKKKALLGQVTNIEERIELLKEELSAKAPRKPRRKKVAKRTKQKKPAKISKAAGKLGRGVLKDAIALIVGSSQSPISPKQVRDAIIAKKIYKKPPAFLPKMIDSKLRGPEFKRAGRGKYVLKEKSGK